MAERVGVYTSIAPVHELGEEQQVCARSWMDAGYKYTTVNGPSDDIDLPDGARCVRVGASAEHRRPYIYLDSLIQQALMDEVDVAIITNSDIELLGDITKHIAQAQHGMVIGRRVNHRGDPKKGEAERWGIDVFILSRAVLETVRRSLFVLGQTWWDYWLPYWCLGTSHPVYLAKPGKYGHRSHKIQHSPQEWARMTCLFQGMTGYMVGRKPHDTGMAVWKMIQDRSKAFE